MLINIIGAGKLGKSLGRLIAQSGFAQIGSVFNTTQLTANKSCEFIGQGIACAKLSDINSADVTFITTPDDKIAEICFQLVQLNKLQPKNIIVHCSGSLSSDILSAAKAINCMTASLHPIRSFVDPNLSVQQFHGTFCAIECEPAIFPNLSALVTAIGGQVLQISKETKSLYHAGMVIASNYLVTLFDLALKCLIATGISLEQAKPVIASLMESSLQNLTENLPAKALTGPIKRGDNITIEKHIEALSGEAELLSFYKMMGRLTIENLTTHSPELKNKLLATLQHL